jgi:protoporphyrinogen oxidase
MRADIEAHGGVIHLKTPVSKVHIHNGKVSGVEVNGHIEQFDTVISTVPLPYIPKLIPEFI